MDYLVDNKSKFEEVSLKRDPNYEMCLKAIEIIKDFIKERGLIIYGGTAIDYALRLHGDKIYPDEELTMPDLDFYSPDNVKDAYDLADILYAAKLGEVRAIRATFVKTMRVDVGNQFLADITYSSPNMFKKLPFLLYEGMKIIHPNYQRMDMHIGLTYLYESPPREALFARWKFIKRLNLMDKYYPLPDAPIVKINEKKRLHKLPYNFTKYVFSGSVAYSMMCKYVSDMQKEYKNKLSEETNKYLDVLWNTIPLLRFEIVAGADLSHGDTRRILYESYDCLEYIHFDIDSAKEEMKLIDAKKYADTGSFLPKYVSGIIPSEVSGDESIDVKVYSSKGKYVSIGSIAKSSFGVANTTESKLRFVSAQYLFSNIIGKWIITGDDAYIVMYNSLMKLVKAAELISIDSGVISDINPLLISTAVYGDENVSETVMISLKQLQHDIAPSENVVVPKSPVGYYPSRGTQRKTPDFDYESSELFIKDGRRLHD